MLKTISQGDVIFVNFNKNESVGSEEYGVRPVVVVSHDVANSASGLVIVCPITSKKKKRLPTHYKLTKSKYDFLLYENNIVLTENVRSISKYRLERIIGKIDKEDISMIIQKLNKSFT